MAKTIRTKWTDADNYEISKAVLKEYAIKRSSKPVREFVDNLTLPTPHSKGSLRVKVQNTKYLLEDRKIPNTLTISARPNCSKAHGAQFDKARMDLGI